MASPAYVYAKSFYNIAVKENLLDVFVNDFKSFVETWVESIQLRRVLTSPVTSAEERKRIFESICEELNLKSYSKRALSLLSKNNRFELVEEIYHFLLDLKAKEQNLVVGEVQSVIPLDETTIVKISSFVENSIGKKVQLVNVVDRDLLVGFIVRVDGKTFDASVRSKLNNLQEALIG